MGFNPLEGIKEIPDKIEDLGAKFTDVASKFSKDVLGFDPSEVKDRFATPYEDRLDQAPANTVIWDGPKGESLARPNAETDTGKRALEALKQFGLEGIVYENGYPKFDTVAVESVKIDDMNDNIDHNYRQADTQLAKQWTLEHKDGKEEWNPREVAEYRTTNRLTWHESEDLETCHLIPRDIHQCFTHCGGRCEYKNQNNIQSDWE